MKPLSQQEQYALLAVYNLKDNAYLSTIRSKITEFSGNEYAIGTIYTPLHRLWKQGYLEIRVSKPSPKIGGRSIKYYKITSEGIAILEYMKTINDKMWIEFKAETLEES